jgi:NAD-dependent DNA ligase
MTMTTTAPTGRELAEALSAAAAAGVLPANLRGKTYVMTGKMSMKRDDLRLVIRAAGGRTEDRIRVYGLSTILVVGDTGRHGETSKIRDARNRGCQVISEDELVKAILGR